MLGELERLSHRACLQVCHSTVICFFVDWKYLQILARYPLVGIVVFSGSY